MRRLGALVACGVLTLAPPARGDSERPPLPEALLTESATDIDSEGAGELELEANLATVGARTGAARATLASFEAEWRILRELGLRLEPSYAAATDAAGSRHAEAGLGGALAFGLLHDFAHDFHLQAELLARTPDSSNARVFEPGETELPLAADLLSAVRAGRWTLRGTAGLEAGRGFAHAPAHTDLALATGVLPDARFGFFVLNARFDWAREAPFVLAPEVIADTTPLGLPFRLGVALPVNVGADASQPSMGLFVRLILLTGREQEYGRTGG